MIIDKDGKVFGKVSIIDILFIILIVAVFTLFFKRLNINKKTILPTATSTNDKVVITLNQNCIPDYIAESIKEGMIVKDLGKDISFGEITSVKIGPSKIWDNTMYGASKPTTKSGYSSVEIKTIVNGKYTENGLLLNNNKYYIGNGSRLKLNKSSFYGTITNIEKRMDDLDEEI